MALPEGSVFLKLGFILNLLAGIPVIMSDNQRLPKCQVIITGISFICHILCIVGFIPYYINFKIATLSIEIYNKILLLSFIIQSIIVFMLMVFTYKSAFKILTRLRKITESIRCTEYTTNPISESIKVILTLLYMLFVILDHYNTFMTYWDLMNNNIFMTVYLFIVSIPQTISLWATGYNLCIGYMTQCELVNSIDNDIVLKEYNCNLNSVLPVVEEEPSNSPDFRVSSAPWSLHRCSPGYSRRLQCQNVLEKLSQLKKLRLQMNQWYYIPSTWFFFNTALSLPALASGVLYPLYGEKTKEEISSENVIKSLSIIGASVLIFTSFGPIFLNHFVKYKIQCTISKARKEIFMTKDVEVRKKLMLFVQSATDPYPESPCRMFEFDISFLMMIIDTVLLVTTTFFVDEK